MNYSIAQQHFDFQHFISVRGMIVKCMAALMCCFWAGEGLMAQTWTGSINTDWNNPGNWSGGIVPLATDDITIPDVANDPIIMAGTLAAAKSVTVQNGAVLTVAVGGTLGINGAVVQGILNQGVVENSGAIGVGLNTGVGPVGIDNQAIFNNNAGGQIFISRSTDTGLLNSSGTFTNQGIITVGASSGVGLAAVKNKAVFNNSGGQITIHRANLFGIYNESTGTFTNNAGITIGGPTSTIGNYGLISSGTFINTPNGLIKIDRSQLTGLASNESGTFTNQGTITIGETYSVGKDGLQVYNGALFFNAAGGIIHIDRCAENGVKSFGVGTFTNEGTVNIGANNSPGLVGMGNYNLGTIQNNIGGVINIDRSTEAGIRNQSTFSFNNQGTITMGAIAGVGSIGIDNQSTVDNSNCAALISIFSNSVITNTGTFNNAGGIIENASGNSSITNNTGVIQNLNGGTITTAGNPPVTTPGPINVCGGTPLLKTWTGSVSTNWNTPGNWSGSAVPLATDDVVIPDVANDPTIMAGTTAVGKSVTVQNGAVLTVATGGSLTVNGSASYGIINEGTVGNNGIITIGSTTVTGLAGINNQAVFNNNTGGQININRTIESGFLNSAGTVTNQGTITIGALASVGAAGVNNKAVFNNNAGGMIKIDLSTESGFLNTDGTVTNQGTIIIGALASVGTSGVNNKAEFNNNTGGQVNIDRSTDTGFLNTDGTVNNQGIITVGALSGVGFSAVKNQAVFNNNSGGQINIHRSNIFGLYNEATGTFTNNATITIGITATIGNYGLISGGTFTNAPGGLIKIDRSQLTGLASNESGTFTNQGTVTIGAMNSVGKDGLQVYNGALFFNAAGGILHIDRCTENGVKSFGVGTFTNEGTVNIGANNSPGLVGVGNYNLGTIQNNPGGIINIDRSTEAGIRNQSTFSFNNQGTITMGAIASVGSIGIDNQSTFDNSNCAALINIISNSVITNTGTFNNAGGIIENASGNSSITNNTGVIQNLNGGTFTTAGNPPVTTPGPINACGGTPGLWTGSISTNWNTPGNWSSGTVPLATVDVTIPDVANDPTIMAGTAAVAQSVTVQSGAVLTVAAGGSLTVNGAAAQGIFNQGTVANSGTITVGSTAGVGPTGIDNQAIFNNNTGGQINIDRSTDTGFLNTDGTVNNQGIITIGALSGVGFSAVKNQAVFNNNSGGQINIHRSNIFGLYNEPTGTFTNNATITIGITATIGNYGLISGGTFTNTPGGLIKIDRSQLTGLASNESGTFTNQGTITIGATNSVGKDGMQVYNGALFFNAAGGTINLDRTSENGVANSGVGSFTNEGTVNIGANNSPGLVGLNNYGFATFYNNIGGVININRSTEAGIRNQTTLSFNNEGTITMGAIAGVGSIGIDNQSTFDNSNCAALINIISNSVITNTGTFNNAGGIIENASGNSSITNNTGVIQNLNGGTFTTAGNPPVTTPGPVNACCTSPEFTTCPANISVNTQTNTCQAAVTYTPAVSGSPAPALTYNFTGATTGSGSGTGSGSNFNRGITNVTITATASCGSETCSFTVTVTDNIQPTVVCKPYTAALNAAGQATVTPANVFQSGTDNCGVVNLESVSPNNFTCANIGTNSVTLTANDGNGNTGTCTATVTVSDPVAPTMLCRNAILTLNAQGQATLTTAQVNNGSFDNCSITSLVLSQITFTCANMGNNPVTLTGTDPGNNQGSCTATVTIIDPVAPTALCKNATLALNAQGQATLTTAQVNNGSSDNCSIASLSLSQTAFTCANVGISTVTLTAGDGSGNTGTCTATVTVTDPVAPTALCKNATLVLNAQGQATLTTAQVNNGSSDNCSVASLSLSQTAFTCANVGATTVTLTTGDGSGNTGTCTATVTVTDPVAPTALCKNATLALNAQGQATLTTVQVNNGSSDNCSVASLSLSQTAFTCANVGATTVTLTAGDGSGNTGTCTATVTVTDPIAPTMLCKNATLLLNAQGQATLTTAQVNNGSFDNCSIVSLTLSQTVFTCANVGNNIVTLTGIDPSNNLGKCTATVTVTDPILPVALCKNATINLNAGGNAPVSTATVNNGSSDNCSFTLSVTPAVLTCVNIGVNIVTLKATDQSGNTATCTARVTIKDVSGPVAKCKNPTVYLNAVGEGTLSVAEVNNGSTDNCGIASMSINQTTFNCSELLGSPWPVVLSMVDVNGNTSSCTASVSVRDAIAPMAICEDQTVTLGSNGKVIVLGQNVASNSIDNCSVWSYSPVAKLYTTANIGPNNLTVTVKDWSGNPATCTAVITVLPFSGFQSGGNSEMQSAAIEPSEMLIYPNPTAGDITMIFELPADQSYTCRIFDTAGRMVMNKEGSGITGENVVQMQLEGLSSGMYMVDFQSDSERAQQRLVIQR